MSTKFVRTIAAFTLVPVILACSLFSSTPAPSESEIEKEEQAIYSFFVADNGVPAVILRDTATNITSDDPQQTIDYIKSGLSDVSKETINNYLERNKESTQLSPNMDLGNEYILLSPQDFDSIFNRPDGWDVFYSKYPNTAGYFEFSRVGFNKTQDQALVYMGNMAGPLMGGGIYYLMEKVNGEWVIKQQIMVWIS